MHGQIIDCSPEASSAPQVTSSGQGLNKLCLQSYRPSFFFVSVKDKSVTGTFFILESVAQDPAVSFTYSFPKSLVSITLLSSKGHALQWDSSRSQIPSFPGANSRAVPG